MCPNCHNPSVVQAKSSDWFEFCFVPLFPYHRSHIWMCNICRFQQPQGNGWEPQRAPEGYQRPGQFQQPGAGYPPQQGMMMGPGGGHPQGGPPHQGYPMKH
ncbi:hypothetical protein FFLO_01450 [Filobasidium floriforme]|uniref:Uncharacterized protein n=1 Tax=Filobasidium floriforme TaxID=5210 RepID=A0A8K0JQQ9_9TREE|nr:hypothetical protein FFLO_01450 [Filobasidium floriforme]